MTTNENKENTNSPMKAASGNYQPAPKTDGAAGNTTDKAMNEKIIAEIKKTWNKLSDDEIKMYETQPEKFFEKVKVKQGINRDEAAKQLKTIKTSCGCGSEKAA